MIDRVPPGFLVDSRWLDAHGIAKSSASDYNREGWLERKSRGVYRRPLAHGDGKDAVDWKLALLSAQWIMGYDFHVGGTTALTLDGRSHYLGLGRSAAVYLYGQTPAWLPRIRADAHFVLRRRQLFGANPLGLEDAEFDPDSAEGTSPWDWPLRRSSPERALLEALNELPEQESFHTIDMLFEGLSNLRPSRLDELLGACRSIKVKRLFLLFADRHSHSWLAHMNRDQVDIGKGPRSLVEGGRYVPDYELVVPPEFADRAGRVSADGP